ncbi:MAG: outer membrane lipoprotein-sorting protein [Ignavibacteriae bacterium]|nr:MAG: outer membrane lipoprotein-sorting protein [Ignavibacteriota bacterium]
MKKIILTTIMLSAFVTISFAQTGRDIMLKADNRPEAKTVQTKLTMTIINKRGKERVRKLQSYSMDVGKDKKTLMFFEYPGDVKGTGFLTWDYDKIGEDDDKWLYMPAMKKTRRISGSSAKKDYFMGTDFTYDDMGDRNIDEDTHKLLGEETINGHKCWKVESISKDKRDIFSKKIIWMRQDILIPEKVDFYDRMGKLHRQMVIEKVEKNKDYWVIVKMTMTNVQTNHKTIIEFDNMKLDVPMNERKFTVKILEKGRM